MPEVFISYAQADEDSARQFAEKLEGRGFQVGWLDRVVTPGESWVPKLQEAISGSDVVFVLVSRESVESQWVTQEIAFALAEAEQGRPLVIPVLLDPSVEVPFFLRHIQGLDLSKPEKAEQQLDALVRSLESGQMGIRDRAAELNARASGLRLTREALEKQVQAQESRRAAWSATISASTVALAVVATLMAAVLGVIDFTDSPLGRWLLPFGLGVLASLGVAVVFELLKRRSGGERSTRGRE